MTTHIAFNNEIFPLTPSTLESAMVAKLSGDKEKLQAKLKRAKSPFTKLVLRSRIAELNYKLQNL